MLLAASVTALSMTAGGCVVVHGERKVLPAATRAEAAKAVAEFTAAYNKADKAYDSSLDAAHTTGALAVIDGARLKAGRINSPGGNADHTPLVLTDVKYTITEKAGWPRWFVADAKSNKGGDDRWVMVFTRGDLSEPWQAAYLTLVAPGALPEFATDENGRAEAVPNDSAELAVAPQDLSKGYASYLKDGGNGFADGKYTSALRADRAENAEKPGLVQQYIDEPLTNGDFAPLALRTADGGAVVFFSTHHYLKQTGASVPKPNKSVQALTSGEIKQSLTMEFYANEIAVDPPKGSGSGNVSVISRLEGFTAAKGE